jgi:hypothetical protein
MGEVFHENIDPATAGFFVIKSTKPAYVKRLWRGKGGDIYMKNETTQYLVEMYNNWEAPKPLSYPPQPEVRMSDYVEAPETFQEVFANPNVEVPVSEFGGK